MRYQWHMNGDLIRRYIIYISGWWFGTWLLFSPIVGMMIQSDELIFFRGVGIPPTRLRDWEKSWEKLRWSWELLKPVWLPIHLETCYYDVHFHLVGGLEHGFYFPLHIWDVILPIDELIFFKMVIAPPTSLEIGYNGISMAYEGGFNQEIYNIYISGWWFGTWLLFSPIVGMMIQSDELIFFRGVGIPPTRLRDWGTSWETLRWSYNEVGKNAKF